MDDIGGSTPKTWWLDPVRSPDRYRGGFFPMFWTTSFKFLSWHKPLICFHKTSRQFVVFSTHILFCHSSFTYTTQIWDFCSKKLRSWAHVWLAQLDRHQTSKPVKVSFVTSIPIGRNFNQFYFFILVLFCRYGRYGRHRSRDTQNVTSGSSEEPRQVWWWFFPLVLNNLI